MSRRDEGAIAFSSFPAKIMAMESGSAPGLVPKTRHSERVFHSGSRPPEALLHNPYLPHTASFLSKSTLLQPLSSSKAAGDRVDFTCHRSFVALCSKRSPPPHGEQLVARPVPLHPRGVLTSLRLPGASFSAGETSTPTTLSPSRQSFSRVAIPPPPRRTSAPLRFGQSTAASQPRSRPVDWERGNREAKIWVGRMSCPLPRECAATEPERKVLLHDAQITFSSAAAYFPFWFSPLSFSSGNTPPPSRPPHPPQTATVINHIIKVSFPSDVPGQRATLNKGKFRIAQTPPTLPPMPLTCHRTQPAC